MATDRLRERIKENLTDNRKTQREKYKDKLRCGLGLVTDELKITPEEVQKLCNRIKRRKVADQVDIYRLSQAFLNSLENIRAFMLNQGAINVLIKELTGSSGEKQILSAEAICNLSLGDPVCCAKIANLTGSYLLLLSTSVNSQVARTSLWTLYNLIAESPKALGFLLDQKLYLKLLSILEGSSDLQLKADATRCLSVVVAEERFNHLGTEDIDRLIKTAVNFWNDETPRLLFELSKERRISTEKTALLTFSSVIHYLANEKMVLSTAQQLYSIRTLGQLVSSPFTHILVEDNTEELLKAFNSLLQAEDPVFKEAVWCLGLLVKSQQSGPGLTAAFIEEMCQRLIVPRKPDFEFNRHVQESQRMDSN